MPDGVTITHSSNEYKEVIPYEADEKKRDLGRLRRQSTMPGVESSVFEEVLDIEKFVGYLL
jgi:hypothetical protein